MPASPAPRRPVRRARGRSPERGAPAAAPRARGSPAGSRERPYGTAPDAESSGAAAARPARRREAYGRRPMPTWAGAAGRPPVPPYAGRPAAPRGAARATPSAAVTAGCPCHPHRAPRRRRAATPPRPEGRGSAPARRGGPSSRSRRPARRDRRAARPRRWARAAGHRRARRVRDRERRASRRGPAVSDPRRRHARAGTAAPPRCSPRAASGDGLCGGRVTAQRQLPMPPIEGHVESGGPTARIPARDHAAVRDDHDDALRVVGVLLVELVDHRPGAAHHLDPRLAAGRRPSWVGAPLRDGAWPALPRLGDGSPLPLPEVGLAQPGVDLDVEARGRTDHGGRVDRTAKVGADQPVRAERGDARCDARRPGPGPPR